MRVILAILLLLPFLVGFQADEPPGTPVIVVTKTPGPGEEDATATPLIVTATPVPATFTPFVITATPIPPTPTPVTIIITTTPLPIVVIPVVPVTPNDGSVSPWIAIIAPTLTLVLGFLFARWNTAAKIKSDLALANESIRHDQNQAIFQDSVDRSKRMIEEGEAEKRKLQSEAVVSSGENSRLTALDVVSQRDIKGLQDQIDNLKAQIIDQNKIIEGMRQKAEIDRQAKFEAELLAKTKADADALVIKNLQETVDRLTREVTDLKGRLEEMIRENTQLKKEASDAPKGEAAA